MKFIGRKNEMAKLGAEYKRDSSFVVIYGRRRVGKTTLIKEFLKDKTAFYFLATEEIESQSMKRLVSRGTWYSQVSSPVGAPIRGLARGRALLREICTVGASPATTWPEGAASPLELASRPVTSPEPLDFGAWRIAGVSPFPMGVKGRIGLRRAAARQKSGVLSRRRSDETVAQASLGLDESGTIFGLDLGPQSTDEYLEVVLSEAKVSPG